MFTRVHKKKDQVGQCMSLRGAKRRGNLPVQSLVIEALKVSVGPTPEKSSKTEHFTRRLPRPDGLAMTDLVDCANSPGYGGRLGMLCGTARRPFPTVLHKKVGTPLPGGPDRTQLPHAYAQGSLFLSAKLCNRLCQRLCGRFGLLQGIPGGADLDQQGPGAEVLVVAVF